MSKPAAMSFASASGPSIFKTSIARSSPTLKQYPYSTFMSFSSQNSRSDANPPGTLGTRTAMTGVTVAR